MNGDGRPDVIAVGGGTAPGTRIRRGRSAVVTTPKQTPGIISSATADLDGDGKAEVAIAYEFAMNEPTKGKLLLATQGEGPDDPWRIAPVADVGSIHRLRWGSVIGTPRVPQQQDCRIRQEARARRSPIFGPSARPPAFDQEPAHLVVFDTGPTRNPVAGRRGSSPMPLCCTRST